MSTIEITTSQNVVISYETAEIRERAIALVIDIVLLILTDLILFFIINTVFGGQSTNISYLVIFITTSFYTLFLELLMDGQTPGKRLLGIKVLHLSGQEPSLNSYLLRWAFRLVDIWASLGAIAIIVVNAGGKGQRLGDVIANTTVVRVKNKQYVDLLQIAQMNNAENYVPVFPAVDLFSEADMLLLKEVMDRASKYRNKGHQLALDEACRMAASRMGLQEIPASKIEFIRQMIKDFVALSR